MIDHDIYLDNSIAEDFMRALKEKIKKDNSSKKVYISTARPYDDWLYRQYFMCCERKKNGQ